MYTSSNLRKGLKIEIDDHPWVITEFEFCKPGKGQALYRCKLKNMITAITMDRTFRANDKFEKAVLDERDCIYSYNDGDNYIFSDNETYEEIYIKASVLGEKTYFLIENAECKILLHKNRPIDVTLPTFIEKKIANTEPGVRGDTATNVTKTAKLDNGYEIQVPLFVNNGDMIKIDTRTGEYSERISKA